MNVTQNPSFHSIVPLHQQVVGGFDIRIIEIPVSWANAWVMLLDEIERLQPAVVIATGVADTDYMRFEILGRNAKVGKDIHGVSGGGAPIVSGGPSTIDHGLPAIEMTQAMNDAGHTAHLSDNAGEYLCNFVLYNLMYCIQNEASYSIVGGFIHVPPAPTSSFQLSDITTAHVIGIEALSYCVNSKGYKMLGRQAEAQAETPFINHEPPDYERICQGE